MAIDLSQFSNEDLLALKNKDLSKISNQGLMLLKNASDPTIPTPSADDGRQERKLNLFQKGVNTIADVLSFGASKPYKENVTSREIEQESPLKVAQAITETPIQVGSDLGSVAYAGLGTVYDFLDPTSFGVDTPFSQRVGEAQNRFPFNYDASEKGEGYYKKLMDNMAALPGTSQFSNVSRMSGMQKGIKADKGIKPITMTDKVNKEIQLFVNKPFKEQLKDFNLNVKKNTRYKKLSDEGYQFIPSQINNAKFNDKLKEASIGTGKASEIAREANQKVTNRLTRKYLGVSDDTPLDLDLLNNIRRQNGKIYAQIDNLPARPSLTKKVDEIRDTKILMPDGKDTFKVSGKGEDIVLKQYRNGREILEDLKTTRFDSSSEWNYFKRTGDPAVRKKAVLLDKKIEKLEDELIDIAKYNNKENLIPELKKARTQIAKAHLVQKALNDVSGNVNAQVISKLAYDKKLLDPNIQAVAKMNKGYKDISSVPKSIQQPPFTVLDIGLSIYGGVTGNPSLAVPTISKYQASKYLFTPKTQSSLRSSQLNQPKPKGIRSLLQIPNVGLPRPSERTFNTLGLASLLNPRLVEDLEQQ